MSRKKYQVFVSSTFTDLKDERQAVSRAILNLGHIPAGMELFPATDIDQLSFIKKVIDDCDYYLLIIGGRYGTTTDEGLSYTELEFNYAFDSEKPILAFLHADVTELKAKNVDSDPEKSERLEAFRTKVKNGRIVQFWTSLDNLESKALVSLTTAFNDLPQTGWRRDTNELSEVAQRQIEQLRGRYEATQNHLEFVSKRRIAAEAKIREYEALETSEIEVKFISKESEPSSTTIGAESIIREFASGLRNGITSDDIERGLLAYIMHKVDSNVTSVSPQSVDNIVLFLEVFEIANEQANGLISLMEGKAWLLKAAFKPLKKVMKEQDDAIPF